MSIRRAEEVAVDQGRYTGQIVFVERTPIGLLLDCMLTGDDAVARPTTLLGRGPDAMWMERAVIGVLERWADQGTELEIEWVVRRSGTKVVIGAAETRVLLEASI